MSLSAYRIGSKVWIVSTARAADPELPQTLPIGSVMMSDEDAREFAEQILAATTRPVVHTPRVGGKVKS